MDELTSQGLERQNGEARTKLAWDTRPRASPRLAHWSDAPAMPLQLDEPFADPNAPQVAIVRWRQKDRARVYARSRVGSGAESVAALFIDVSKLPDPDDAPESCASDTDAAPEARRFRGVAASLPPASWPLRAHARFGADRVYVGGSAIALVVALGAFCCVRVGLASNQRGGYALTRPELQLAAEMRPRVSAGDVAVGDAWKAPPAFHEPAPPSPPLCPAAEGALPERPHIQPAGTLAPRLPVRAAASRQRLPPSPPIAEAAHGADSPADPAAPAAQAEPEPAADALVPANPY